MIAYDPRIRTLQEFTSDPDKITASRQQDQSRQQLQPHGRRGRGGVRLLRTRPADRRRIILLIGETRDMGSEAKPRETLTACS